MHVFSAFIFWGSLFRACPSFAKSVRNIFMRNEVNEKSLISVIEKNFLNDALQNIFLLLDVSCQAMLCTRYTGNLCLKGCRGKFQKNLQNNCQFIRYIPTSKINNEFLKCYTKETFCVLRNRCRSNKLFSLIMMIKWLCLYFSTSKQASKHIFQWWSKHRSSKQSKFFKARHFYTCATNFSKKK